MKYKDINTTLRYTPSPALTTTDGPCPGGLCGKVPTIFSIGEGDSGACEALKNMKLP
jgi:hypothetical protein